MCLNNRFKSFLELTGFRLVQSNLDFVILKTTYLFKFLDFCIFEPVESRNNSFYYTKSSNDTRKYDNVLGNIRFLTATSTWHMCILPVSSLMRKERAGGYGSLKTGNILFLHMEIIFVFLKVYVPLKKGISFRCHFVKTGTRKWWRFP